MRQHIQTAFLLAIAVGPAAGNIDTIAGTGKAGHSGDGGKATDALLDQPFHCDLDGKGQLFIADANSCQARSGT